jgi:hypothetical protein
LRLLPPASCSPAAHEKAPEIVPNPWLDTVELRQVEEHLAPALLCKFCLNLRIKKEPPATAPRQAWLKIFAESLRYRVVPFAMMEAQAAPMRPAIKRPSRKATCSAAGQPTPFNALQTMATHQRLRLALFPAEPFR